LQLNNLEQGDLRF